MCTVYRLDQAPFHARSRVSSVSAGLLPFKAMTSQQQHPRSQSRSRVLVFLQKLSSIAQKSHTSIVSGSFQKEPPLISGVLNMTIKSFGDGQKASSRRVKDTLSTPGLCIGILNHGHSPSRLKTRSLRLNARTTPPPPVPGVRHLLASAQHAVQRSEVHSQLRGTSESTRRPRCDPSGLHRGPGWPQKRDRYIQSPLRKSTSKGNIG